MDDLPFRGQTFLVATSEDLADKVARAGGRKEAAQFHSQRFAWFHRRTTRTWTAGFASGGRWIGWSSPVPTASRRSSTGRGPPPWTWPAPRGRARPQAPRQNRPLGQRAWRGALAA